MRLSFGFAIVVLEPARGSFSPPPRPTAGIPPLRFLAGSTDNRRDQRVIAEHFDDTAQMKILLVEDDERLSRSLARLLEQDRHNVEIAPDGETGVDIALGENGIDVVI